MRQLKQNTEHLERINLSIEGMTCAACVNRIEKTLSKIDGVQEANVNIANEKASVSFNPAKTDMQDIVQKIESLGYNVPSSKIELAIEGMTCSACVNRIEKKLSKINGVSEANVNLANERATIKFQSPAEPSEFIQSIEELGYKAQKLRRYLIQLHKKNEGTSWCKRKSEC